MKIKRPDFILEAEKKLKVIWDLLKKTDAVRFRLTVKLYREDRREPIVITMEGTRAEKGKWNVQAPLNKRTGPIESGSELQEKLKAIEASVRDYISRHSLDEEWRDWSSALNEVMSSGRSTDDLEYRSQIPVQAIAGHGYDAHFFAPVMAMAYVIEGTEALTRNDLEQASRSVERGMYWSRDEMLISDPRNRFVGRARTGGGGKAARYKEVKEKVAELLRELRPEGWDTSTQAVDVVADKLTREHPAFVEERGLQTGNLSRTIKGWLKKAPDKFPHLIKPKE
ncbi:hypothetical protein [Burkholderia sp. BE17]|uniref:hypothetical protein n=1 Tax=Burkholderia sp. BE17 TaxID=2656644 RepID=UPI0014061ED4|nr:hypothetical protein [Burkholderia sp. BE17]MPV67622.1 hypothetical protein [Burkholderia sp. BE17]